MKTSTILSSAVLALSTIFSSILVAAPVNVNTASAEEIAKNLKGIGLTKAQAMVEYRQENGKFLNHEHLTDVKGIGEKTVEKNKEDIKL